MSTNGKPAAAGKKETKLSADSDEKKTVNPRNKKKTNNVNGSKEAGKAQTQNSPAQKSQQPKKKKEAQPPKDVKLEKTSVEKKTEKSIKSKTSKKPSSAKPTEGKPESISKAIPIAEAKKQVDAAKKILKSVESVKSSKTAILIAEAKKQLDEENRTKADAIEAKALKKKLKRQQQKEKKRKLLEEEKQRVEEAKLIVFKLNIRNLPPNLSEESFIKQIQEQNTDFKTFITNYYYVKGYYPVNQFEANVLSRCYLNCSDETTMMSVGRTIKQMTFKDDVETAKESTKEDVGVGEQGVEEEEVSESYSPVIEKSFLQFMPDFTKQQGVLNVDKWDFFNGKLEENTAYKKFLKAIESEGKIPVPEDVFNKIKPKRAIKAEKKLKQKSATPEPQTAAKKKEEKDKEKKKKKRKKAKDKKEAAEKEKRETLAGAKKVGAGDKDIKEVSGEKKKKKKAKKKAATDAKKS